MEQQITVTVAGKEPVGVARGTTVGEVLGESAKGAVAALSDGTLVDLHRALEQDCSLTPLPRNAAQALEVIRHSTAHLLAQAVKRLYPQAQVTIGPVIDDGFYYDFKYDAGFSPDDLQRISEEMQRIVDEDLPISREELGRDQAAELFREMGEDFKVEIVAAIEDDVVGLYRQGEVGDLWRRAPVASAQFLTAV